MDLSRLADGFLSQNPDFWWISVVSQIFYINVSNSMNSVIVCFDLFYCRTVLIISLINIDKISWKIQ
jgi:hypothetical protein